MAQVPLYLAYLQSLNDQEIPEKPVKLSLEKETPKPTKPSKKPRGRKGKIAPKTKQTKQAKPTKKKRTIEDEEEEEFQKWFEANSDGVISNMDRDESTDDTQEDE
jgi:hypothetical protein